MLARYIALIVGSKFALWFALVTSGEFGFEREVIEKIALDRIPFPDPRQLCRYQWSQIDNLFEKLRTSQEYWKEVDAWVADLYGFGSNDLQIISDTLAYNLPFAETKIAAQSPPENKAIQTFCSLVLHELTPWANRFNVPLEASIVKRRSMSPWIALLLQTGTSSDRAHFPHWEELLTLADATAATELVVQGGGNALLIARLAQNRYWSETQAHLLAQQIIWSHLDIFGGQQNG